MTGDCHVRFCERPGAKLPRPTDLRAAVASAVASLAMMSTAAISDGAGEVRAEPPESPVPAPARQSAALIAWVKQHSAALRTAELPAEDSDLRALDPLIDARTRVVGFGEPVHGAREPLLMRNRLLAYLVEHHGVTAYAAETSFTSATGIDDYVTGKGELTEDVWKSVYIAGPRAAGDRWDSTAHDPTRDEDWQLLHWMRQYNQRPATQRPIRFYGIDICSKSGDGTGPCMRAAVDAALAHLALVDPAAATGFDRRLRPFLKFYDAQPAQMFSGGEQDAVTASITDLVSLFAEHRMFWIDRTSAVAYHRAYRNAVVAQRLDAWLRLSRTQPAADDIWVNDMGKKDVRDSAMAENVLWALEREGAEGRLFLFAHDAHLDKSIPIMTGALLRETLGPQYVVIGSTGRLAQGSAATGLNLDSYKVTSVPSLTALLESTGKPISYLDVRTMPPLQTHSGERARNRFRAHITSSWRVQGSYDALIHFDSLSSMWRYRDE